jgi:hypothetical protein
VLTEPVCVALEKSLLSVDTSQSTTIGSLRPSSDGVTRVQITMLSASKSPLATPYSKYPTGCEPLLTGHANSSSRALQDLFGRVLIRIAIRRGCGIGSQCAGRCQDRFRSSVGSCPDSPQSHLLRCSTYAFRLPFQAVQTLETFRMK